MIHKSSFIYSVAKSMPDNLSTIVSRSFINAVKEVENEIKIAFVLTFLMWKLNY